MGWDNPPSHPHYSTPQIFSGSLKYAVEKKNMFPRKICKRTLTFFRFFVPHPVHFWAIFDKAKYVSWLPWGRGTIKWFSTIYLTDGLDFLVSKDSKYIPPLNKTTFDASNSNICLALSLECYFLEKIEISWKSPFFVISDYENRFPISKAASNRSLHYLRYNCSQYLDNIY